MDYQKQNYLTKEGLLKLKSELGYLKNQRRRDVAQKIKEAKDQGDLSENAEYAEAKEEQAFMEGRILELEELMKTSEVVDESVTDFKNEIGVGSCVKVLMDAKESKFFIVGPGEADPASGKISYESPLGQAFLGKKEGDEVHVEVPKGSLSYKVLEIC